MALRRQSINFIANRPASLSPLDILRWHRLGLRRIRRPGARIRRGELLESSGLVCLENCRESGPIFQSCRVTQLRESMEMMTD